METVFLEGIYMPILVIYGHNFWIRQKKIILVEQIMAYHLKSENVKFVRITFSVPLFW